jgi:uncharacterized membrane protein YkoI
MRTKLKGLLIVAGVVAAAAGGGAAIAGATGDGEREDRGGDRAITGDAFQRASGAALKETGGGRVTGTETGDEESYYEVEVTKDDGTEVDVQLDRGFTVVGSETDREDGD